MNRGFGGAEMELGIILAILGIVLLIVIPIVIFYLLTLQKALSRVSPRNRLMEPGMVWLMLIPCFNIVWQFFVAVRVPGSLQNEFRDRGRDDGSDYGKGIALTAAILGIANGALSNVLSVSKDTAAIGSCVSLVVSLTGLVLFIVFWVKIAGYSSQLAMEPGPRRMSGRDLDDDDDDDLDYRRPARGTPPPSPTDAIQPEDRGPSR